MNDKETYSNDRIKKTILISSSLSAITTFLAVYFLGKWPPNNLDISDIAGILSILIVPPIGSYISLKIAQQSSRDTNRRNKVASIIKSLESQCQDCILQLEKIEKLLKTYGNKAHSANAAKKMIISPEDLIDIRKGISVEGCFGFLKQEIDSRSDFTFLSSDSLVLLEGAYSEAISAQRVYWNYLANHIAFYSAIPASKIYDYYIGSKGYYYDYHLALKKLDSAIKKLR